MSGCRQLSVRDVFNMVDSLIERRMRKRSLHLKCASSPFLLLLWYISMRYFLFSKTLVLNFKTLALVSTESFSSKTSVHSLCE